MSHFILLLTGDGKEVARQAQSRACGEAMVGEDGSGAGYVEWMSRLGQQYDLQLHLV